MPWPASPHSFLAGQCEVCRQWCSGGICAACIAAFAHPLPRCSRCALQLGAAAPACGNCLRDVPPFERTDCVADYAFPWDRLIVDFKFHGRPELATPLAALLAAAVGRSQWAPPDIVLPVPLSPGRLSARGYNQAWELARRVARRRRLPARADVLLRPIESLYQADLARPARLANLRAAFIVDARHAAVLRGRRVALVDDVLTTGATAREASRTLLQAGAAAVDVWVLARTP